VTSQTASPSSGDSPIVDASSAQLALADPATPAAVLAQIAQTFPQLHAGVAAHPNAYPALLDWLDAQGDPGVAAVVARRRADAGTPPPPPVSSPAWQLAAQSWPQASPLAGRAGRRLPGKLAAVISAVGLVVLGLIVWLVIVPALHGGRGAPNVRHGVSPHFAPIVAGGLNYDQFYSVAIAPDGGLIAAGTTFSKDGDFPSSHGGDDALLARFTPDGTLQWAKTMGGTDDDGFFSVAVAPDGSLIAAGGTASRDGDFPASHGIDDALLAWFAPDGTLQWAKTMGGTDFDHFNSVAIAPDGSLIAAGGTASMDGDFPASHGSNDGLLARFTPDGTLQWAKTMGGTDYDGFASVAVAPDASLIAAGTAASMDGDFPASHGDLDGLLANFDPDGTLRRS